MATHTKFEEIKRINEIGQEYWSARELYEVLEYIKWDKFLNVIDKAKQACLNSGQEPNDHFPRVEKLVVLNLVIDFEPKKENKESCRYSILINRKEHKAGTKNAKYSSVTFAKNLATFVVINN
jgi:DNA-damage-inducible protein D